MGKKWFVHSRASRADLEVERGDRAQRELEQLRAEVRSILIQPDL
ncbi:hypothetical protein QUB63_21825 [Microcoleus sp. ARI1-B5]